MTPRVCQCGGKDGTGCTETVGPGERRRYKDEKHRDRAYRNRIRARAEAAGLPPRLTVAALSATRSTRIASADAPRPRNRPAARREGVTVYLPSVEIAVAVQEALRGPVDPSRELEFADRAVTAAIDRRQKRRR